MADDGEKVRAKHAEETAQKARNAELARRAVVKKAQDAAEKTAYRPLVG